MKSYQRGYYGGMYRNLSIHMVLVYDGNLSPTVEA